MLGWVTRLCSAASRESFEFSAALNPSPTGREVRGGSVNRGTTSQRRGFIEMPCFRQQQPLVQRVLPANSRYGGAHRCGTNSAASTGLGMVSYEISQPGIREAWWRSLEPIRRARGCRYRPLRGHEWSYAISGSGALRFDPGIRSATADVGALFLGYCGAGPLDWFDIGLTAVVCLAVCDKHLPLTNRTMRSCGVGRGFSSIELTRRRPGSLRRSGLAPFGLT